MTFREWGETSAEGQSRAMWLDWKAEREKLLYTLSCIAKIEDDMDNFLRARAILAEVQHKEGE